VRSLVVLAGRATRVPQAAVTSGIQRTVTVNSRRPLDWAPASDLGWGKRPKLHGMQGVRGSSPLSSTTRPSNLACPTLQELLEQAELGIERGACRTLPTRCVARLASGSHDPSGQDPEAVGL
jgi:hypothetical protein